MLKLYKQDSRGRLRIWSGWTIDDEYFLATGLVTGKMNESKPVACISKNVGRSNQTTPQQQAILELNSKYAKKLDEGYFKTQEEAKSTKTVLPMLAYKYEDGKVDWEKYGGYVSRKLDGHRMLAHCHELGVDLITRKGKTYTTLEHIEKDLENVYLTYGECWLDGEVYVHGQSFQENTKLIKKYRPGETDKLTYQVYDIVLADKDVTERELELKTVFYNHFDHVFHVEQFLLESEEAMKEKFSEFIADGYEGIMIKEPTYGYQIDKRSNGLLKYKEFLDAEFEVVNIIPAPRRTTHGVVVLKHADGREFQANLKGSWEEREELLTNKNSYIGKWATIVYFEETDSGLPRFPVLHGFRYDDVKND